MIDRLHPIENEFAGHFIANDWIVDSGNGDAPVINPANGVEIGRYALGSRALTDRAIEAARKALHTSDWSHAPRQRAEALLKFARNMEMRRDELISTVSYENGKILVQAAMEIDICISEAKFYAGLARTIFGRMSEITPGNLSLLAKEPIGVAGIIVPWNAPATLLVRSLAPALAAGCTTVIKPAPQTPLINKKIVECFDGIEEIPSGVINSVNENGAEVGKALVQSSDVDVISFTGSSATGKAIMSAASGTLKRLSLELGGKAPTIVFPDASMEKAIAGITQGATIIAGQMCVAITRVLVHRDCIDEVADRLKSSLSEVKIGPGYEAGSQMGPLIDKNNQQRAGAIIEKATQEGQMILKGQPLDELFPGGAFISPTLFRINATDSELVQEEHFAPILSLEPFDDERGAIKKANATRYGLAASVWTQDIDRAMRMSKNIKSGTVWINCHNRLSPESETGGYRESGLGRLHGVDGLNDFLETKNIYFDVEQ